MSIDLEREVLLTIDQARQERVFRHPQTDAPAPIKNVWRWVSVGVKRRNGRRVKLEAIRCPQGLRTSREAIQRFVEALSAEPVAADTGAEVVESAELATV